MISPVTAAVAQLSARRNDTTTNLARAAREIQRAADIGASLIVFPECYLTGYLFHSRREVEHAAVSVNGSELDTLTRLCAQHRMHVVIGFLERSSDQVFNTAALVGPTGTIGLHRKRHLPYLGADRFVDEPSDPDISVFTTPFATIGLAICYEIRFPEVSRTLALAGADIITLPTCWPVQSRILAENFTTVRAAENFIYFMTANRCDSEEGIKFLGLSRIVDPTGRTLADAGEHQDSLIVAELDIAKARDKSIIIEKGEFEVWPWRDRRPHTYHV